eukprot:1443338-Lingulodinium_polyedra.AAC.1
MHNGAVESTVRGRAVSRIARFAHSMRTPNKSFRMDRARRAICEPLQRQTVDSTTSLRTVSKIVHNGAV